jgi:hypothetical protein
MKFLVLLFFGILAFAKASKIIDTLVQPQGTEADPKLKLCYKFIPFWPMWCPRESQPSPSKVVDNKIVT